jgi:hypothetical protein
LDGDITVSSLADLVALARHGRIYLITLTRHGQCEADQGSPRFALPESGYSHWFDCAARDHVLEIRLSEKSRNLRAISTSLILVK